MISFRSFKKIFGRNFWKSFSHISLALPSSPDKKEKLLRSVYEAIKKKTYHPKNPEFYVAYNKGRGVARICPVFTLQDYIVYFYCVIRLEFKLAKNRTENTFGGWSISGLRYRSNEDKEIQRKLQSLYDPTTSMPSWSFAPTAWVAAYRDFNAKLYVSLKEYGEEGYAIELDIANFYDSVNLTILKRKISEVFNGGYREELSLLFHFLNYWNKSINHYDPQTVGLPQDVMSDCSRILANFYLQEYDVYIKKICDEVGAKYFRYADDQVIVLKDFKKIDHILYSSSRKLSALGLAINQKKVDVKTIEQTIEYRSYRIFDLLLEPGSQKDPEQSRVFISEVINILSDERRDAIRARGIPLLNRALSCNWERVNNSKRVKLFSWYLDDDYLKSSKRFQFSAIYGHLQSEKEKNEFLDSLTSLSLKIIHNGFHYEVMAFFKEIGRDFSSIEGRIATLKKIYHK